MSERYTYAQCAAHMAHLAHKVGATCADASWPIDDPRREDAWFLDHNATYGGYVIRAYSPSWPNSDGPQTYTAEHDPMWAERHTARRFCQLCRAAIYALAYADNRVEA